MERKKLGKNERAEIEFLKECLESKNFNSGDSNVNSIRRLKELSQDNPTSYDYCLSVVRLAEYYYNTGNYTQGIPCVVESIGIAQAQKYKKLLSMAYMTMAFLLNDMMDDTNSLEYYLKGLDLSRADKDSYRESLFLNNIGDLFMQSKQYELARPYIKKAISCFDKYTGTKNMDGYIIMLMNMVKIHLANNECDDAEKIINKASSLVEMNMNSNALLLLEKMELAYVRKDFNEMNTIGKLLVEKIKTMRSTLIYLPIAEDGAEMAIYANNKKLADSFMNYLYTYDQSAECSSHSKRFVTLLVEMFKQFNMVNEYAYGYKKYVEVDRQLQQIAIENKAISFVNKINLHKLIKKQESMNEKNKKLKDLSGQDELTKTANRRAFNKAFQGELKTCARSGKSLALIYFDVDYFKQYNDTYGHVAGDKVLKSVAQVLKSEADMYVARVGGDEFITYLCDKSDDEVKESIVRCRERLNNLHIEHSGSNASPFVTFTCGYVNMIPDASTTTTDMVNKADSALYSAKLSGRNAWCEYKEEMSNE